MRIGIGRVDRRRCATHKRSPALLQKCEGNTATAFRAIKKENPQGKFFSRYDLTKFRTLFLAGERADPDTVAWAENLLKTFF